MRFLQKEEPFTRLAKSQSRYAWGEQLLMIPVCTIEGILSSEVRPHLYLVAAKYQ